MKVAKLRSQNVLVLAAVVLGAVCGWFAGAEVLQAAEIIAEISVRLMKLIAIPVLFLSIVVSVSHFDSFQQVRRLGKRIVSFTLFTTLMAALIAQGLYLGFGRALLKVPPENMGASETTPGFFKTLLTMIPDNVFTAFAENNVMAVVLMAIVLALCLLSAQAKDRQTVFSFFNGLLSAVMRAVHVGLKFLPLSVWAFVTLLFSQVASEKTESLHAVLALTLTVIAANLIQGLVFLPGLLRYHKIKPFELFWQVRQALMLAFFTRSSSATLPVTIESAIENAKVSPDVARLSLSLCTTINMNGCAQFVLLSVYFVSHFSGHHMGPMEQVGMIFLSVLAAVGNAGVPMGCFFLASSILASKDIPLTLMGTILPLYAIMDMVETTLNVWSDVCIAKLVDQKT